MKRGRGMVVMTALVLASCRRPESSESVAPQPPASSAPPSLAVASPAVLPSSAIPSARADSSVAPVATSESLAPERYLDVVPRVSWPFRKPFSNLVYEGDNRVLRAASDGAIPEGAEVARRWRDVAQSARKVFVLRDALFSQPDHPYEQDPVALMMPPSWITVAVAAVLDGAPLRAMSPPIESDDAAWAAVATEVLFGSFPASTALLQRARLASSVTNTLHARRSILELAIQSAALIEASARGPEAVASAGADRIAAGDRAYFGETLRREHVIPIAVENPSHHEVVDEGKGLVPADRLDISPRAVALTRKALLRRRLRDGDLAIERYDLSKSEERTRALTVLTEVIPKAAPEKGGDVWLWVNGTLDSKGVKGEDATAYVETFRAELARADVELGRLHLFGKPQVELGTKSRHEALDVAIARYESLGMSLSVNLRSEALRAVFAE